jgi:hypothetical protein
MAGHNRVSTGAHRHQGVAHRPSNIASAGGGGDQRNKKESQERDCGTNEAHDRILRPRAGSAPWPCDVEKCVGGRGAVTPGRDGDAPGTSATDYDGRLGSPNGSFACGGGGRCKHNRREARYDPRFHASISDG